MLELLVALQLSVTPVTTEALEETQVTPQEQASETQIVRPRPGSGNGNGIGF